MPKIRTGAYCPIRRYNNFRIIRCPAPKRNKNVLRETNTKISTNLIINKINIIKKIKKIKKKYIYMMKFGIILVAQRLRTYFGRKTMNLSKNVYLDASIYLTKY